MKTRGLGLLALGAATAASWKILRDAGLPGSEAAWDFAARAEAFEFDE
jgi:hypothetical protein